MLVAGPAKLNFSLGEKARVYPRANLSVSVLLYLHLENLFLKYYSLPPWKNSILRKKKKKNTHVGKGPLPHCHHHTHTYHQRGSI